MKAIATRDIEGSMAISAPMMKRESRMAIAQ